MVNTLRRLIDTSHIIFILLRSYKNRMMRRKKIDTLKNVYLSTTNKNEKIETCYRLHKYYADVVLFF